MAATKSTTAKTTQSATAKAAVAERRASRRPSVPGGEVAAAVTEDGAVKITPTELTDQELQRFRMMASSTTGHVELIQLAKAENDARKAALKAGKPAPRCPVLAFMSQADFKQRTNGKAARSTRKGTGTGPAVRFTEDQIAEQVREMIAKGHTTRGAILKALRADGRGSRAERLYPIAARVLAETKTVPAKATRTPAKAPAKAAGTKAAKAPAKAATKSQAAGASKATRTPAKAPAKAAGTKATGRAAGASKGTKAASHAA